MVVLIGSPVFIAIYCTAAKPVVNQQSHEIQYGEESSKKQLNNLDMSLACRSHRMNQVGNEVEAELGDMPQRDSVLPINRDDGDNEI